MKKKVLKYVTAFFLFTCITVHSGRSPYRSDDPEMPTICVQWEHDNTNVHVLTESHLQEGPFFHLFDRSHFESHMLPTSQITFRNSSKFVSGKKLSQLIENFLAEVKNKKKKFTDFTILKMRDFNREEQTGLIVAKFKEYPFVIKLFAETPCSFVKPFAKGFEPTCFHIMSGGCNRHLSGFTRIKNLEWMKKTFSTMPQWRDRVQFPRKWYWLPNNDRNITITSSNVGPHGTNIATIPSMYAIVADYIDARKVLSLKNRNDRRIAMQLSNDLNQNIDPHITNYVIEKNTEYIVPIDTEHFPTFVGIQNPPECKSYFQWYSHLSFKMLKDGFFRLKHKRKKVQRSFNRPIGPIGN